MRFALLGDHPDGLDMARALAASGRHELTAYSGPPVGAEYLRRWGLTARTVPDLEEVLADPAIDAVLVAGGPATRAAQLRRALQSERHVLCVHPADDGPDTAYEALMIQGDTGKVLMPLLAEALHPAFRRLAELTSPELIRAIERGEAIRAGLPPARRAPPVVIGLRLLEVERWSGEEVLLDADAEGHRPGLPGWDVLRALGGEVAEVFALAPEEEATGDEPLLLAGRFERGGLFQASLLPHQPEPRYRLTLVSAAARAELVFPVGWPGPARLSWVDEHGEARLETWEAWNPWPALVEAFEAAVAAERNGDGAAARPGWEDEVRCLELDDAARRSVARRRASTLDYQEATEEASFKGTMTLTGCATLWVCLVLLILSVWLPWLGWFIGPLLGLFLLLQLLRWALPPRQGDQAPQAAPTAAREPASSHGRMKEEG